MDIFNKAVVTESEYCEEWYQKFYTCRNCNIRFMVDFYPKVSKPNFCPGCGKPATVIDWPKPIK